MVSLDCRPRLRCFLACDVLAELGLEIGEEVIVELDGRPYVGVVCKRGVSIRQLAQDVTIRRPGGDAC